MADTRGDITLSEFLNQLGQRSIQLNWPSGEVHSVFFGRNRAGQPIASYSITHPETGNTALVSDSLLVASTKEGFMRLNWPTFSTRGMYPFVVLLPLSMAFFAKGNMMVRANLRRGNGQTWEELARWEAQADIGPAPE